ncbi:GAF domain-containing protein [Ottowia sp.]|uniref:GAF domain-containing protein n=1 Tax=Ottowia sp. TaxID=1898956 RepID=UPI0039E50C01
MTGQPLLQNLAQAAHALGRADGADARWAEVSRLAEAVFSHRLLTGLVYLREQRLMRRIFTSDESISPLGGFKATGRGPWSVQVLEQGLPYVGSDEADIRTVFSEADLLIERGLHAVLNIPIWFDAGVIGSINLLGHRHAYDQVSEPLIDLMAGLCTPVFIREREAAQDAALSLDRSGLDSV